MARVVGKATSIDDLYARLFSETIEQMLEAELTDELGYEPYEAKGRNSGNSRNGHYASSMRTSGGDAKINVPPIDIHMIPDLPLCLLFSFLSDQYPT